MHQPQDMSLRWILIYPYNEVDVDETFRWNQLMTIEVVTLNLDDSWKGIYGKLMGVVGRG